MHKRFENKRFGIILVACILLAGFVYGFNASSTDYNSTISLPEIATSFDTGSYSGRISGSETPLGISSDYNAGGGFVRITSSTVPTVTITSPSNGLSQTSTTVTLSYTGFDDEGSLRYFVRADSGSFIDNNSNTSYAFTSQSVGSHVYYVRSQDRDGQLSSIVSVSVTVNSDSSGSGSSGSSGGGSIGGGLSVAGIGEKCFSNATCSTNKCINNICSECSTSLDCSDNESCSLGVCTTITAGQCGQIINHLFEPFACCSNLDCASDQICDLPNHVCVNANLPKLTIEAPESNAIIFGKTITIRVLSNGEPVSNTHLFVNDSEHVLKDGTYSLLVEEDSYDLVAFKEGYASDRLTLLTLKELSVHASSLSPAVGETVTIEVKDASGLLLSQVEILVIYPDGNSQVFKTDDRGIAFLQSYAEGKIQIVARKQGYAQGLAELSVGSFSPLDSRSSYFFPLIIAAFIIGFIIAVYLTRRFYRDHYHRAKHRVYHHISHTKKRLHELHHHVRSRTQVVHHGVKHHVKHLHHRASDWYHRLKNLFGRRR